MSGIYVHIPFCVKKCDYCDFVSFPENGRAKEYISALLREIELCAKALPHKTFDTVFFGGGTPSSLPPSFICAIMAKLKEHFDLNLAECTIECNPGTVEEQKLAAYREAGFNRLSFGVQSFDGALLAAVGRIHTPAQARECVALARAAGFDNVNLDLMYGLPEQTATQYLSSLDEAAALGVSHISAYSLILEEGTPLYERAARKEAALPDEDEVYEMQCAGTARLEQLGYRRYEISNYAMRGFECRHNINYWNNGEYLGLGLNSHSAMRVEGRWMRWHNSVALEDYIAAIALGKLPREDVQSIGREEEMFECVMLGLRKIEGVERAGFLARFGADVCSEYPQAVEKLKKMGWLNSDARRVRLTSRGLDMQNAALLEFMR